MTKKSQENEILAKGNNSCESRLNATNVKLDMYYAKTNPYTKFQVNILKGRLRKVRKTEWMDTEWTDTEWTDWLTDRRMELQTARKPIVPPVSPEGD